MQKERSATTVNDRTTINLKMAATVLVVACAAVFNLSSYSRRIEVLEHESILKQKELERVLSEVQAELKYIKDSRWRSLDDYLFTKQLCELNNLKMPENHKGIMYE
jgi:hypothetical protein